MRSFGDIALSFKASVATAGGTVASGLAQFLGLIPEEIGKLSALLGLCLSIVMISYWRAQTKKTNLESELIAENIKKMRGDQ
jgi:hypothetical protein